MKIGLTKIMKASLAGIGLGLVFLTSSCVPDKAKPLNETVARMRALSMVYSNSVRQAGNICKNAFKDNFFSESEQKSVYYVLEQADEYSKQYNALSKQCVENPGCLYLSNDFPWYAALEKNVAGFDTGEPKLQKFLSKQYLGIRVESIYSDAERKTVDNANDAVSAFVEALSDMD